MNAQSSEIIHDLFIREEQKSEKYANYARLLFTVLYIIAGISIKKEIPEHSFNILIALSVLNLFYGAVVFVIIRKNHYFPWLKYLSVIMDIIILSSFLYSIGTYRTFKTEAFMLYYLWIALATIRFSPKLTAIAGILTLSLFTAITMLAAYNETVQFGSITESFTTQMISSDNLVLRLIFLTVFILLAIYISNIFRHLVAKTVNEIIISQENIKLAKELKDATEILQIDPLTQLYNRRRIGQLFEDTFEKAQQEHKKPVLIMADIDHFKSINDRFGHPEGDKVLIKISQLMKRGIRENDLLGRWGGEEFLIILPQTDIDTALFLCDRLRRHVSYTSEIDKTPVTCSFGLTLMRDDDTVESFIRRADEALYLSKNNGRNRVTHL